MIPLLIDHERLKQLRRYSETHVLSLDTIKDMIQNKKRLPDEYCTCPDGVTYEGAVPSFNLNYTVEHQPGGVVRHISYSVKVVGRVPNPAALIFLMQTYFGFKDKFWFDKRIENSLFVLHAYELVADGHPLLE